MTTKKTRNRKVADSAQAAVDKLFPDEEKKSAPEIPLVVEHKIPENLPADEQALLDKARTTLAGIEKHMVALVRAAFERWKPAQSVYNADETGPLVFSDEEYAVYISMVERLGEVVLTSELAKFMGLPTAMVDAVIAEKLRQKLVPSAPLGNGAVPFVVKRSARGNEE